MRTFFLAFVVCSLRIFLFATEIKADFVYVRKSEHTMTLYCNKLPIKKYKVAIGRGGSGQKESVGDNRTPEGIYKIDYRNSRSGYYKSMHISYPNSSDMERIRKIGEKTGGDIMLHGIKNGWGWLGKFHRLVNWTQGCIAVTNKEMDEIWSIVPDGTTIEIKK